MDSGKSKPGPKKKSNAEFLEGKKTSFTNSDKGSCILNPHISQCFFHTSLAAKTAL